MPFGESPGVDLPEGCAHPLKALYKKALIADPNVQRLFASIRMDVELHGVPISVVKDLMREQFAGQWIAGMDPVASEDLLNEIIDHFLK